MQNISIRTVTLAAATATEVAPAWSGRRVLRIINIGTNLATLGTTNAVVAGTGWPLAAAAAAGDQGGGIDFDDAPDAAIWGISTSGTTLCVMEG